MTTILAADDNSQNLYLLVATLNGSGFDVVPARNGAEALALAEEKPPDLVVTDILMPVMDGFELCRRWRAHPRLKDIPFVFYTATYTDPKDEKFAMSLGADRFVVKPQKPDVLVGIVREVLSGAAGRAPAPGRPLGEEMEVLRQYNEVLFRKLEQKVLQLENEVAERKRAEERISLVNRKLALINEVTGQDIKNKVTGIRGFAELSRKPRSEEERAAYIEKEIQLLDTIHTLIEKTKDYEHMGVNQSQWNLVPAIIRTQFSHLSKKERVVLACDLPEVEVFSDPLIDRVFYNIMHNAIRHGKKTTRISFTSRETPGGLVIACEDDGVGIDAAEKGCIFDRVVGGEGRFGLFFVREFLSISGMSISETGTPGAGARFEILVPKGLYRIAKPG